MRRRAIWCRWCDPVDPKRCPCRTPTIGSPPWCRRSSRAIGRRSARAPQAFGRAPIVSRRRHHRVRCCPRGRRWHRGRRHRHRRPGRCCHHGRRWHPDLRRRHHPGRCCRRGRPWHRDRRRRHHRVRGSRRGHPWRPVHPLGRRSRRARPSGWARRSQWARRSRPARPSRSVRRSRVGSAVSVGSAVISGPGAPGATLPDDRVRPSAASAAPPTRNRLTSATARPRTTRTSFRIAGSSPSCAGRVTGLYCTETTGSEKVSATTGAATSEEAPGVSPWSYRAPSRRRSRRPFPHHRIPRHPRSDPCRSGRRPVRVSRSRPPVPARPAPRRAR